MKGPGKRTKTDHEMIYVSCSNSFYMQAGVVDTDSLHLTLLILLINLLIYEKISYVDLQSRAVDNKYLHDQDTTTYIHILCCMWSWQKYTELKIHSQISMNNLESDCILAMHIPEWDCVSYRPHPSPVLSAGGDHHQVWQWHWPQTWNTGLYCIHGKRRKTHENNITVTAPIH